MWESVELIVEIKRDLCRTSFKSASGMVGKDSRIGGNLLLLNSSADAGIILKGGGILDTAWHKSSGNEDP